MKKYLDKTGLQEFTTKLTAKFKTIFPSKSEIAIQKGETKYNHETVLSGNNLNSFLYSVNKKRLNDIAIGSATYADIFEGELNIANLTFDSGSFSPYNVNLGSPTVSQEEYASKSYSLKAFGSSTTNIASTLIAPTNGHTYFIGSKVNVKRRSSGYAGVRWAGNYAQINYTTTGFIDVGIVFTATNSSNSNVVIGSHAGANLDCYIDDVFVIDITDFYSQFASDADAIETMFALIDDYITIKNDEPIEIAISTRRIGFTDAQCQTKFLQLMNGKAQQFGMANTLFNSPSGLTPSSYTTPQDLLKLGIAAASNHKILDILATWNLTLEILGDHKRTATFSNSYLSGLVSALDSAYIPLGGKPGSLTLGSADADYYRAQFDIVDIDGKAVALSLMAKGQTAYSNIYTSANELCQMMEDSMNGETVTEGTNLAQLVSSGGGYAACVIPNLVGAYQNHYPPSALISREFSLSNGETIQSLPASTSKIMTMLIALDYITNLNDKIVVKESDISSGSGSTYYDGDTMSAYDAMRVMAMESSNTLANTIARTVGEIALGI